MAGESSNKAATSNPAFPYLIALAGWLVPGLGHLLLRRWGRALAFFLCVGTLAVTGLLLRGHVFSPSTGDAFELLGFAADVGAGIFFLASKFFENGGPDVSVAAGDYGTRFFATAGVLNLLCALDAHDTAAGLKE